MDEEIESSVDEELAVNTEFDEAGQASRREGALQPEDDPFFKKDEEEVENEDERRLRMTKKLIKAIGEESKEKEQ